MKKLALLAAPLLALGLMSCSSSNGSSSTAPSSYTDVKASSLTSGDKAFLLKLQNSSDAFGAIAQSSKHNSGASSLSGARKAANSTTCTSPMIIHDEFWQVGDSLVFDSTALGAQRYVLDDTTTSYDAATGKDITCSTMDYMSSPSGIREVSRQAMKEGSLLTTSMGATFLSQTSGNTITMTGYMKGLIRYIDGFTLDIDTAYVHMVLNFTDSSSVPNQDLYYHLNFVGYAYSATLRYNKATEMLEGDIVRGSDRIGTMKVHRDDSMEVRDLDGNLIKP